MDKAEKMAIIKDIAKDGVIEVNGRKYKIMKYTHSKRVQVLASISMINKGDLTCLGTPEFSRGEKVFLDNLLFNDMAVSRIDGHFEKYPEDYLTIITLGMAAVCVPFGVGGSDTGSKPSTEIETT